MNPLILYATAALMALVGVACAVLCVAWSIPSLRRQLANSSVAPGQTETGSLTGWPARVGSALISAGIAACALVGWYGCYCVLTALSVGTR